MFYLGKIALLFNYFSLVHTGLSYALLNPQNSVYDLHLKSHQTLDF